MSVDATTFGEDVSNFMDRWVGSVAVVTGASSGIGAATVEKLVKIGLTVVGLARRMEVMEGIASKLHEEKGKFIPMFCDITMEQSIIDAFAWIEQNLGGISILINNAGITKATTLSDGDTSDWKAQLDVNILAVCICTREAVTSMKKHELDGHIIHINSIAGHYIPEVPCLNVYPATKHAVTALTECLRRELRALEKPHIKISSISPGLVATEFIENFTSEFGIRDAIKQANALAPEDIAEIIVFVLATPPNVQVHDLIVKCSGETF